SRTSAATRIDAAAATSARSTRRRFTKVRRRARVVIVSNGIGGAVGAAARAAASSAASGSASRSRNASHADAGSSGAPARAAAAIAASRSRAAARTASHGSGARPRRARAASSMRRSNASGELTFVPREAALQERARVMELRLRGPLVDLEDAGDLRMGEPLDDEHHEDHAGARREAVDLAAHGRAEVGLGGGGGTARRG